MSKTREIDFRHSWYLLNSQSQFESRNRLYYFGFRHGT